MEWPIDCLSLCAATNPVSNDRFNNTVCPCNHSLGVTAVVVTKEEGCSGAKVSSERAFLWNFWYRVWEGKHALTRLEWGMQGNANILDILYFSISGGDIYGWRISD